MRKAAHTTTPPMNDGALKCCTLAGQGSSVGSAGGGVSVKSLSVVDSTVLLLELVATVLFSPPVTSEGGGNELLLAGGNVRELAVGSVAFDMNEKLALAELAALASSTSSLAPISVAASFSE